MLGCSDSDGATVGGDEGLKLGSFVGRLVGKIDKEGNCVGDSVGC